MTDDLTTRLRSMQNPPYWSNPLIDEAADRIEALEAERVAIIDFASGWVGDLDARGRFIHAAFEAFGLSPAPVPSEALPDVCPECGKHRLTGDDYAMSHSDWVAFNEWSEKQSPWNGRKCESSRPSDD